MTVQERFKLRYTVRNTTISAVAVTADRTAYDVRYTGKLSNKLTNG